MLRFRSLCARRWLRDEVEKGAMPVWQTLTRRELFRGLSVLAVAAGRAESAQPSNFFPPLQAGTAADEDRKSTRLNSSHSQISYAVFCLKKKKQQTSILLC